MKNISQVQISMASLSHFPRIKHLLGNSFQDVYIEEQIRNNNCYVGVVEDAIRAVALMGDHFFQQSIIEYVVVQKDYQGEGIGRGFLKYFERRSISDNLFACVSDSNDLGKMILEKARYIQSGYIYNIQRNEDQLIFAKNIRGNMELKNMKEEIELHKKMLLQRLSSLLNIKTAQPSFPSPRPSNTGNFRF